MRLTAVGFVYASRQSPLPTLTGFFSLTRTILERSVPGSGRDAKGGISMSIPHLVDRLVDLGEITQADIEWAKPSAPSSLQCELGPCSFAKTADTLRVWKDGLPGSPSEQALCGA